VAFISEILPLPFGNLVRYWETWRRAASSLATSWSVCYIHFAYLCLDTLNRICNSEHRERYLLSLLFFLSAADENFLLELSLPCLPFDLNDSTVTALSRRYLDQAPNLSTSLFPAPVPKDIASYLHTSSASTVSSVKCVSISHKNIINGSQSRVFWFKKVWPQQGFNHLRVLGWSSSACLTTSAQLRS
jgi:hypothetical protein